MKRILILLLLSAGIVFPQKINLTVKNSNPGKAFLYSVSGEKTTIIDSAAITGGAMEFTMNKKNLSQGIYRISISRNQFADFIFDGNSVNLITDAKFIVDSMNVSGAGSNKLFYEFIKLNRDYKSKTELLQLLLARYPKDDPFYSQAKRRLNDIQSDYTEFVNVTSQDNPGLFVAQYIRSSQLPVVDAAIPIDKQLAYLKAHALDFVDFSNSALVNSDAFSNKAIEYLTYFRNPQFPKELLEKEFCAAIDSILNRARVNSIVYQHVVEYLIDGFKRFGFDIVLDYIVSNYVIKDDLCLDVKTEGMIKRRIDQAKFLKIGSAVPDFSLPGRDGKTVKLSTVSSGRKLIVFYTTQCPHCSELMPKLENYYKNNKKKLEIIAVCLDKKKEEWQKFFSEKCPSLINVCDLKGWDSDIAGNYFLYATPTIFLIDKNMKITAKPMTYEEIVKAANN